MLIRPLTMQDAAAYREVRLAGRRVVEGWEPRDCKLPWPRRGLGRT